MNRTWFSKVARSLLAAASFITVGSAHAEAQTDIVLHAKNYSRVSGAWQQVADSSAASGIRMWNPDQGAGKLGAPYASPTDFFELTFTVDANQPYRIWMRGKADNNYWTNDSVFLQFSNSVNGSGTPIHRIGSGEGMVVSVEACSGCGLSDWGWEDNGYGSNGAVIYFSTSGTQTVRVQRREDGISIDQIVLSRAAYFSSAPGSTKNDTTILGETTGSSPTAPTAPTAPAPDPIVPSGTGSATEIVLTAAHVSNARGNWRNVSDSSAAGGSRYWLPDGGQAKLGSPYASPGDYVELSFTADAGRPYRLWMRGKADGNSYTNDSVFVQFTGSVDAWGSATYRIGSGSATVVSIEACTGCGLSGWGWEDNGYGGAGALVYFATSGPQTMRIQRREDGISFDQVVLSAQRYLSASPGNTKNDNTILSGSAPTSPTPAPEPEPEPEPAPAPAPTPAPTPTPSPSGNRLRLLEWNIHHGVGTDGVYDIDRIASAMASMNPDVVMLNEVERYTGWGYEDQPERFKQMMQQKTGRTWYMHFAQEFGNWSSNGKGHLILSVYPFETVGQTTITPSDGLKGAGAIAYASISVNYRTLNLFLTHLDPYDQGMRLRQALDVIAWTSGFAENRILVGDMNAWPDQSSIQELNKHYYDSWTTASNRGTAYANSAINPYGATKNGRIDYIFYSKGASNLVVVDSRVYDLRDGNGVQPADHRPVLTTFEVR